MHVHTHYVACQMNYLSHHLTYQTSVDHHIQNKLQQCRDRDQDAKRSEVFHLGCMPGPKTQAKSTLSRLKDSILEKNEEDKFGIEIQHLHHQSEASAQLVRELTESKQTGHSPHHSKQLG